MSNITLGPRGQKLNTVLKYGLLAGSAYAVSHIILGIIAGLIGIAAAGALIALSAALWPVVSLKISNFVMKRFIAEVRANPVVSRMKVFSEMQDKLQKGADQLRLFHQDVTQYGSKVQGLIAKYPQDAVKFQQHYDAMVKMLNLRYAGWEKAKKALVEYDSMTDKVRAIWEVTQASDKMTKAAKRMGVEDAWSKIINDESIRVAEEGMANSFADLDHAMRMESMEQAAAQPGVAALANDASPILLQKDADGSFRLPSMAIPVAREAVPA